ncbi:RcnB family protein [Sphingomonas sp. ac-8]|uniref:RcnB family protein n=1 Tax=Sphingomonas sp. ac-8 TaxID=3242977 RepID=UPI003A809917
MTKWVLMGLLAASALVPASALAQERGPRPQRNYQNEGPQRQPRAEPRQRWSEQRQQRGPQMPQRDYQNVQQQAQPQRREQPQRDFQRERRQTRPDGGRPDGSRNWNRTDTPQRWQDGTRRPDPRPDRAETRPGGRPGVERDRPQPTRPGGWEGRDPRRGSRYEADSRWLDRDGRRPDRGYDRNGSWRDEARQRQDWNDRRAWSRSWRNDRRYDWNGYRQANRTVYRLPRYYPPSGYHYGYRRFSVGLTLGSMLYGSGYWINDPYSYRLPPADGPYRWIRYYNDALLVDLDSGEVVDVVYDLFW